MITILFSVGIQQHLCLVLAGQVYPAPVFRQLHLKKGPTGPKAAVQPVNLLQDRFLVFMA